MTMKTYVTRDDVGLVEFGNGRDEVQERYTNKTSDFVGLGKCIN